MNHPDQHHDLLKDKLLILLSALADLGEVSTGQRGMEQVGKLLLRMLLGVAGISYGAYYCYKKETSALTLDCTTHPAMMETPSVDLSDKEARLLTQFSLPIRIEHLPETIRDTLHQAVPAWTNAGISLLVVLSTNQDLIGIICLSKRFMNQDFSDLDLDIIQLFSRHVSVSLQNDRLIKTMQDYNVKLNRKLLELEHLSEIGLLVTRLGSVDEKSSDILDRAVAMLDARYGALLVLENHQPRLMRAFGFDPDILPDILKGISCLDPLTESDRPLSPLVLMTSLSVRDKEIGTIIVAGKESRHGDFVPFSDEDQYLLNTFGNQAAVALENARLYQSAIEAERIEHEIVLAAEIQQALLPAKPPDTPGLDVAGHTLPCRTIGGDFYDFFTLPNGNILIAIADVSGKGVPASLLVSTFHATLHTLKFSDQPLPRMMKILNELIIASSPDNKFITACIGIWDSQTQLFTFVNAGHEIPVKYSNDGRCTKLEGGGLILGMFQSADYAPQTVKLEEGEFICFYTDGIIDLKNREGDRFGLDRLTRICKETRRKTAKSIINDILSTTSVFQADTTAPDDQTLVIVRHGYSDSE